MMRVTVLEGFKRVYEWFVLHLFFLLSVGVFGWLPLHKRIPICSVESRLCR
jgi:hypothetical protein